MKHITIEQRRVMEALLTKISQKEIAAKLGVSQRSFSREVFRNESGTYTYKARDADLFAGIHAGTLGR